MNKEDRLTLRATLARVPDLPEIVQRGSDWRLWDTRRIAAAIPYAGDQSEAMRRHLATTTVSTRQTAYVDGRSYVSRGSSYVRVR